MSFAIPFALVVYYPIEILVFNTYSPWLLSLIIVLIHINFYINPYLYPLVGYNISGENALYITQNYSYFTLMYTAIIINKIRGN